jgi:hypothetical protein
MRLLKQNQASSFKQSKNPRTKRSAKFKQRKEEQKIKFATHFSSCKLKFLRKQRIERDNKTSRNERKKDILKFNPR